jgi:hypothetical protein
MADTAISALVEMLAGVLAANDAIPVVDVSASGTVDVSFPGRGPGGTTKLIQVANLLASGLAPVVTKTANYTLTSSDNTVIGDPSGGSFTLTLPTAAGAGGKTYTVKRSDSTANNSNTLTVATTSAQTIDGQATTTLDLHNHWVAVRSDGANWQIIDLGPGVRTRFRQTADVTVANTTTETTLFGAGVGSTTLSAGFLVPGKRVRVRVGGGYGTFTSGTITFKVKLGSTAVATTTLTPGASLAGRGWWIEVVLTCRASGVSGSVVASGASNLFSSSNTATQRELQTVNGTTSVSSPVTVDTTAALALDVTVTWSVANAANIMTSIDGAIESLN